MYDPVLSRALFQNPSSTAQGPSAPSAKGTGITSMVTAPDQGAQQLRSFANPTIQPTIRGFADGGFLGGGQSSPLPEGPMSGNPIQTAVSRAVDQAVINPVPNFANGGPVQHFEGGGIASMWQNFVNSRPVKSNPYAVGIPGTSYSGNEPSDSNERDYIRDTANAEAEGEYRRAVTSSQQYIDPEEFAAAKPDMEQGYREALRQQQDVDPNAFSGAPAGIPAARPPSVRNFENPYRNDNTSDSFERAQIEKMKAPSMPPPRPTEERSTISTELNKIREDRKAQSAADRRENALMALMSAGFGMAAGKSRHALQNLAEGGQQGIATFANLEKGRREDDNRRYLAELQERELRMNEPYRAAMTRQADAQSAYLRARPGIDKARLDQAKEIAVTKSTMRAEEQVMKEVKDSPQNYMLPNGKRDQMKIDAEIEKRKSSIYPSVFYDTLNGGRQTDNSSGE